DNLPLVPSKVVAKLFTAVGLAPADDGADLAAEEAKTRRMRPAPGHAAKCLAVTIQNHPCEALARELDRVADLGRRDGSQRRMTPAQAACPGQVDALQLRHLVYLGGKRHVRSDGGSSPVQHMRAA